MRKYGNQSEEWQVDQQTRGRLFRRARSLNRAVAIRALEALRRDYYRLRLPLQEARLNWSPYQQPDGGAVRGR